MPKEWKSKIHTYSHTSIMTAEVASLPKRHSCYVTVLMSLPIYIFLQLFCEL